MKDVQQRTPFSSFEIDFPSSKSSSPSPSSPVVDRVLTAIVSPFSSRNVPVWKVVVVVVAMSTLGLLGFNTIQVKLFGDDGNTFARNRGDYKSASGTTTVSLVDEKSVGVLDADIKRDHSGYVYQPRGRKLAVDELQFLSNKWGSWKLGDEAERPQDDFYCKYVNRDVPSEEFPHNSWQRDMDYVEKFVNEGNGLVIRAMEAILAEYGYGNDQYPEKKFHERSSMFHIQIYERSNDISNAANATNTNNDKGGWTTRRSWEGLKRRLLHAIVTEDTFHFAMGGDGAAAGLGNHLQQSYTLQVQWILEPIFARLGVRHESRNFGNAGVGTMHNAIGSGSIYGPDIDILMYDSQSTEDGDDRAVDLFARQAILGGTKVPLLWNLRSTVSQTLHQMADVDIGHVGTSMAGIPLTKSLSDSEQIVWAAKYVNCVNETRREVCDPYLFNGTCWIPRFDYIPRTQLPSLPHSHPSSSADSWGDGGEDYPGYRQHQLKGRTIAFTILSALQEALQEWGEWMKTERQMLPDEKWHVTGHYGNIRTKIRDLDPKISGCGSLEDHQLVFLCYYPFKARTAFTPRAYPLHSSIRSILTPEMATKIPLFKPNVYDAPDVFNPVLHPPQGEVDVLSIVENGINFHRILSPSSVDFYDQTPTTSARRGDCGYSDGNSSTSCQGPGDGVTLLAYPGDYFCDGTVNSFCNRGADNKCYLDGHNFGRGGLRFDSDSGWVIMDVPNVRHGYIVLLIESWHRHGDAIPGGSPTKWRPSYQLCRDFAFEYSIDGNVTSLDRDQYDGRKQEIQHLVETITVMENPDYFVNGGEKNIEVAIRITGCKRENVFMLTHVYWA